MKSYFANLYLDLCAHIKSNVSEINWIEQDFGQENYDKWRPALGFPAVLIDFTDSEMDGESELELMGTTTISFRLLVTPFTQSYEGAPIEIAEDSLDYFEIEHKLIEVLHGWIPQHITLADPEDEDSIEETIYYSQPLILKKISTQNRNDIGLRIRTLFFDTMFEMGE